MISAKNIHKSFGQLEVLKGFDLQLPQRKITTIVGPSGAGKTTLLHILGTLSAPEPGGSVHYGATDVTALDDNALSRFRNSHIGFVFQNHLLLPEFSIEENVAMPALIAGDSMATALDKARRLLDNLGLEQRRHHRPSELSGGECQRAAVARALINKPDAILADEPSGSLDSVNRHALHELFFKLRDTLGATFVIVTHDEGLAKDSDVVVRMADGKIESVNQRQ